MLEARWSLYHCVAWEDVGRDGIACPTWGRPDPEPLREADLRESLAEERNEWSD